MTVNDIYKCSNVDEDTRFVIDTKEPETIYDGPWYYINDELNIFLLNLKISIDICLIFCYNKVNERPLNRRI